MNPDCVLSQSSCLQHITVVNNTGLIDYVLIHLDGTSKHIWKQPKEVCQYRTVHLSGISSRSNAHYARQLQSGHLQ